MEKKDKNAKQGKKKSFFAGLVEKLDKKMADKSKSGSCCCCSSNKPEDKSCCS